MFFDQIKNQLIKKKLDAARVELDKGSLEKNASKMMDNEMRAELAQLRAEKTTWQASLEQAGREKRFYMENCEQLRKEVVQLQVQKERTYTEQIAGLEKQVADLSRKLINQARHHAVKVSVQARQAVATKELNLDECPPLRGHHEGNIRSLEKLPLKLNLDGYTGYDSCDVPACYCKESDSSVGRSKNNSLTEVGTPLTGFLSGSQTPGTA